ncbi:MAG: hypothetical protein OIF40_10240, partial [Mangrovicoccus sp.]|nr:hypothetical protein [Mangrovicoccus sp.]
FAHPDYAEKDQFAIVDLSAVTQVGFGFRQMLGFVEWAKSTRKIDGPYNPGAVLAPGDAVFGMLRMYDQLGQNTLGYALNICRSREELARALGRSMTDLNRLCGWDGDARTKIAQ